MHSKYYYLVASLPYLKFGDGSPISRELFISECEKWLMPEDMGIVTAANLWRGEAAEKGAAVLAEWNDFNEGKRKEEARIRAAKKAKVQVKIPDSLKSAMEKETPLQIEIALEKIRWDYLEEKSAGYMFDVNWLALYFLKLQILERLATFDKDKGESFFYELCEVKYE
ncbi:MAG: DUF2764 family protein [Candidatus Omnitrophota bacterium]